MVDVKVFTVEVGGGLAFREGAYIVVALIIGWTSVRMDVESLSVEFGNG